MSVDRRSLLLGAAGMFAGFRIHHDRHKRPEPGQCRIWVVYVGGHCRGGDERGEEYTRELVEKAQAAGLKVWDRRHEVEHLSRILCSLDSTDEVASELESQALNGQGKLSEIGGVTAIWVEVGEP